MPDLSFFPDIAQHAPVAKHVAKKAAHVTAHVKPVIKEVLVGVTYVKASVASAASAVAAGAVAFFAGHRKGKAVKAPEPVLETPKVETNA